MYHLLIVDDEEHVVDKLSVTIPWEASKIHYVYQAYSGYEALEIVDRVSVDIIITDITMPGMNGLELIKEVRKKNPKTKCILLSGYGEFAYAKEAVVEGVVDYLLKPVENHDLIEVVNRAIIQLEQEWEMLLSHQRAMSTLKANRPYMRGKLLYDLIHGARWSEQTLRGKMEMLDLEDKIGQPFALMLVRMDDEVLRYDYQSLSLMEYAISNVAEEIFRNEFTLWNCMDDFKFCVFMLTLKNDQVGDRQRAIERLATQLHEKVNQYLDRTISVLISEWGTFPQEVQTIYEQARFAFGRNIGNDREMFTIASDGWIKKEKDTLRNLYLSPALHDLLDIGQWEEVSKRIGLIFDELKDKFYNSPIHIQEVYLSLYLSVSHIAQKNSYPLFHDELDNLLLLKKGVMKYEEVREWADHHLQRLKDYMKHETVDYRGSVVKKIQQFVKERIRDDVSLQAISEYVHMHPNYISKIFKLETGENLSSYTMRIKMEESLQLLRDTPLKVYEIAQELGYKEPHSFIYAFKKFYKMTPLEYKMSITTKF